MYGLVNKSLKEWVTDTHGPAAWDNICAAAKLEVPFFDGMQQYVDALTYELVAAAAGVLNRPAGDILEDLGQHWVLFTGREGYGPLLQMTGTDLPTFLQNLNNLHTRLGRSFPALRPPAFQCTDMQPGSLLLHYRSERDGLTPFVVGLLKGLGKLLQTEVRVEIVQEKAKGAEHDVFRVDYKPHD